MALPWYRVHTVVLNDPGRLVRREEYSNQWQFYGAVELTDATATILSWAGC